MFSSLAKYIFGGLIGNSNEPVECETQEVNDWLLVNLPDQVGKDVNIDIDYEEENEKEEEIDNTEHNVHRQKEEELDNAEHHHVHSEKEEELDNTKHHHVHRQKEEELDNAEHHHVHSEKEEELDNTKHHHVHSEKEELDNTEYHHVHCENEEEIDNTEHHHVHNERKEKVGNTEHLRVHSENEEEIDNTEHQHVYSEEEEESSEEDEEISEEDEESSQEDEESSEVDEESGEEDEDESQEVVLAQKKEESICDYDKSYCELQIPYEVKLSFDLQGTEQVINEAFHNLQKIDSVAMRDLFVYESKLTSVRILFNLRVNQLTVHVRTPKKLRDPASHIKNHASQSAVSPKAELLERIKDLKPAQRAIEYEKKKYISRSQLNRQNRNYIFQASSKTNRRKNLQRHHSGANNNRRC